MHKSVGIVGASGYSGIELARLLASHPGVALRFVTSDRWVGAAVSEKTGLEGPVGALRYLSHEDGVKAAAGLDTVFLCTPAEGSLKLAPALLALGVRVVDLSGAFRLQTLSQYEQFYAFTHTHPALVAEAVYGLPELGAREKVRGARLLSNPGCFATAAALSVAPLWKAGLLEPASVVVNGASGVTGAGRKASEDFSFSEVMDDFRAYRVLKHQHTPEIEQTVSLYGGAPLEVTFTPHLLPLKRGILCTTVARLKSGVAAAAVGAAFTDAYASEPFMRLLPSPEAVQLKAVVGTNRCLVGHAVDGAKVVVVTAIDNLVKGAAGQALQNWNLMSGFDETTGLSTLAPHHP